MLKLGVSIVIPSGILGFYRGTQNYDYKYKKDMKKYNEKLEEYNKKVEENSKSKYKDTMSEYYYKKPNYFYSCSFLVGLFGTSIYINPVTMPLMAMKELYRLEINMRSELDELQNEDDYYYFFF